MGKHVPGMNFLAHPLQSMQHPIKAMQQSGLPQPSALAHPIQALQHPINTLRNDLGNFNQSARNAVPGLSSLQGAAQNTMNRMGVHMPNPGNILPGMGSPAPNPAPPTNAIPFNSPLQQARQRGGFMGRGGPGGANNFSNAIQNTNMNPAVQNTVQNRLIPTAESNQNVQPLQVTNPNMAPQGPPSNYGGFSGYGGFRGRYGR
jgi:hypothetical protein